MNADISTPLIKAFTFAWAAIQARHPEVPDVVITLGAGSVKGGRVLGHFAPHRWQRGDARVHELFVGGEGLERTPQEVMATLLHEAAHGLAVERDTPENPVQDVSRNGRYHNSTFKALGEELGIELTFSKALGWSDTTISEEATKTYRAAIRRLEAAMVAYRRDPNMLVMPGLPGLPVAPGGLPFVPVGGTVVIGGRGRGRASSNNGISLRCECETPRRIRIAPTVAELGPITCGICKQDFS